MATKVSGRSIMKLRQHYGSLMKRTEGIRKKGEATVERMVSAAEVSAASFALGAVQGKYGPVKLAGVPMDLAVGVGLHLAGFVGVAGKASPHLHSFADGALASFFFTMGRGVGLDMKTKGLPGKPATAGDGLDDQDLDRLTRGAA